MGIVTSDADTMPGVATNVKDWNFNKTLDWRFQQASEKIFSTENSDGAPLSLQTVACGCLRVAQRHASLLSEVVPLGVQKGAVSMGKSST
jgi:hypothetical protein